MSQLLRVHFGFKSVTSKNIRKNVLFNVKVRHLALWTLGRSDRSKLLKINSTNCDIYIRNYGMIVVKILRRVLKIRYVIMGSAVGGGITLNSKYNEWRNSLNIGWINDVLPDAGRWNNFTGSLISIKDSVIDNFNIDPRFKLLSEVKLMKWFENTIEHMQNEVEIVDKDVNCFKEGVPKQRGSSAEQRVTSLQEEIIELQAKYQREFDKLEKENRELKKQIILIRGGRDVTSMKKTNKSLIDMYSEVLDELSGYNGDGGGWMGSDHLPRVVVVGDQSAGKTSVLEMLVQARIFPRGAGEMMTRAAVKVTLSEGPYHVAQFRDSLREFDLTKESDLADLRMEVEQRMRNSVRGGCTVSRDVISMSVRGPGLHRMVLVDLPGIISTQTVDMAPDTRDVIREMTQSYMNNPNAIILCIQDGSVDAERSNVTDLVAQCDPSGKRTIFVLTKVDLAEENYMLSDSSKVKKILSGKLFPMKALGYFAVVTGRGHKDDSIQTIRDYEEKFFINSKIFKDGLILSSQVTTRNLSLAVADCFWKMVHASVEQQADAFKATRFNLETEWKNNFPRIREMDREELFERARCEVLDQSINLSMVLPRVWEERLLHSLWASTSDHVFENIYMPAAITPNSNTFNTTVDIKLKQWAENALPAKSVECGWETLQAEFKDFLNRAKISHNHDDIFDNLKYAVVDEALRKHSWEPKAQEMVRVLQLNALQDRAVSDKRDWDEAVTFLENSVKDTINKTDATLKIMMGPSFKERWIHWQYTTEEQKRRQAVSSELEGLLRDDNPRRSPILSYEELAAIRKNLKQRDVEAEPDYIRDTWNPIYRKHFLKQALVRAHECRRGYYLHQQQGLEGDMECCDVILFWRIRQMMKMTANALRQQITNREVHRLDKELKDVLEQFGQDPDKMRQLLAGRRVTLAEDLKRVRQIQEKLEEFVIALNKEK